MEGEKPHGLEEQAGARMAGSGTGGSHRFVTTAEGWGSGFAAARRVLPVWTEPHGVGAALGHKVSVLHGYLCPSVPWF